MEKRPLAVLGTGLMGAPMARRLLEAGYEVTVWNRTPERSRALAAGGAVVASSPAEAVAAARGILLLLKDGPVIEEVLFDDPETARLLAERTVLQMGTIGPGESRDFATRTA
ncbi:MAG TPA: NAD(P)-dependent oxidoreductase, partial [Acidobacteria bacterium]|nr:NAD(P)-dependent oxidoreductase [Acidobacteriota bacterium]